MSLSAAAHNLAQYRNDQLPQTTANNNMAGWLRSFFNGGSETPSGIKVDADNAISLSTVFNALLLLSENVAQLPFTPYLRYEENGIRKRRVYYEHSSYNLVEHEPNPWMNADSFRKALMNHLVRYDRAYALIDRDNRARPTGLYPIPPEWVETMITKDGEKWFRVTNYYEGGEQLWVRDINMFHLIGYTDNGYEGKSRIGILADSIGNAKAAEKFTGQFFGKGPNVSGFIQHPKKLKDQDAVDRLKNSFAKANAGLNNAYGVGVLEEGAEWMPNDVEPDKAQLNETRKVNGQVVAQIWNIPLSFLKYLDSTSYSESEQEDLKFTKYTLSPWCVAWQKEARRKLLTEREKEANTVYFEHDMSALLRGDIESRANYYESMTKIGAFSPNDVLEKESENGYEGGDIHVVAPGAQTIEQLQNTVEQLQAQVNGESDA